MGIMIQRVVGFPLLPWIAEGHKNAWEIDRGMSRTPGLQTIGLFLGDPNEESQSLG